MPARRRVSVRQMELLVEFAESHREIALGRFPGGPQAVRTTREAWNSVAVKLNSVAEGTNKTPDQWRRYWIELKAKTKAKAADSRRNASATGGGPNKLVPLNVIEERVLAIIGPVAVEGLPGVRLPIDIPSVDENEVPANYGNAPTNPVISYPSTSTSIPQSSAPNPISEPLMNEEWLDEEIPSPLVLQPKLQTFVPSPYTETQPNNPVADIPVQSDEQPEVSVREDGHAQPSTPTVRSRRSRSLSEIRRDARVPRWAYDIEQRRIAAEEQLAVTIAALVNLMTEIRDDIRGYVHRTV